MKQMLLQVCTCPACFSFSYTCLPVFVHAVQWEQENSLKNKDRTKKGCFQRSEYRWVKSEWIRICRKLKRSKQSTHIYTSSGLKSTFPDTQSKFVKAYISIVNCLSFSSWQICSLWGFLHVKIIGNNWRWGRGVKIVLSQCDYICVWWKELSAACLPQLLFWHDCW